MTGKTISLAIGVAAFLDTQIVFAQIIKPRVLLERKALKVVADETFPKNLSCEVYLGSFLTGKEVLGSKESPIFEAEGKNGRIEEASMHVGFTASIIVLRKDTGKDSYVLQLALTRKSKLLSLFDLNLDGKWDAKWDAGDVKRMPLKSKWYICLDNRWSEVEKIEGIKSKTPTATNGRKKFEFKKRWVASP